MLVQRKGVIIVFVFPTDWIVYLNGVLIIWLLIEIYQGYKRGLLLQLVDFVGTFVSLFIAWVISPVFEKVYAFVAIEGNGFITVNQVVSQQINRLVWFVILFAAIRLLLMLVTALASFISKMPLIKQVNSAIGGVFAVLLFIFKMVVVCILLSTPIVKNGNQIVERTWLNKIESVTAPISSSVDQFIQRNDAIQSIILNQRLTPEQEDAMSKWLYEKGFNEKEIKEYINSYE